MEYNFTQYEKILRENMGLLKMKLKMPVKDTKALALVYTPGVAASCLQIQNENSRALRYTNKMNSMLVVSDSSGFPQNELNNMAVIPYLEAICVYYKNVMNIDAYPIVIDYSTIKCEEDLMETVVGIMPAFSAIEFFSMCPDRLNRFYDLIKKSKNEIKFAYVDSSKKRKLDESLILNKKDISANTIYAAILRSVLDSQTQGNINIIVDHVVNRILSSEFICVNNILEVTTEFVINNNLCTLTSSDYNLGKIKYSVEYVLNKYQNFVLFGESAWIEELPDNYHFDQKTNDENSLLLHARYRGVVSSGSKLELRDRRGLDELLKWENLDIISNILLKHPEEAVNLTCKKNLGAIITNGTAILGLGNIGAVAGLPVMEGKSVLFKLFGGTDIIPICIEELDPNKFINIVSRITPIFSIINLEDIKSPDCFIIESRLNALTDYPVFHDDQHGTAIVVLAGLINAIKLRGCLMSEIRVVMNGAGAAGLSVTELLMTYGVKNLIICDTEGAIYEGRTENMNNFKHKLASITNVKKESGKLNEIIKGADVFIGLSGPKVLSKDMVRSMNTNPIIFALANPTPEIFPEEAIEAGAFIVATGRSDFPNQINNSLAFPGIFRAAVDVRAKNITVEMKIAASEAIASLVDEHHLQTEKIIPGSLETAVSMAVCQSVARVAIKNNENKDKNFTPNMVLENIHSWFLEEKLINFKNIKEKNIEWKI